MEFKKTSIETYALYAKKQGYSVRFLSKTTPMKLWVSNGDTSCIVDSLTAGFYPASTHWSRSLCMNKTLSQKVLEQLGYRTIPTCTFKTKKIPYTILKRKIEDNNFTLPVILKPENGKQGAHIVFANSKDALFSGAKEFHTRKETFLVQSIIDAIEYRILIVNGEARVAHAKTFKTITGNGRHTVEELLNDVKTREKDERVITNELAERGYTNKTVLKKNESVRYHYTQTSTPELTYYSQKNIPEKMRVWGEKLAHDISCPTVGIDIFIGSDVTDTDQYTIIEINSNPSFLYLYQKFKDTSGVEGIIHDSLQAYFTPATKRKR